MRGARCIIGVGNRDRGDDGVGPLVAQELREDVGPGIEVLEQEGEVASLLQCLEEAEVAYLIDAAFSGAEPGTIHRFDAHEGPLPRAVFALSTHGLGLSEAIELARAMANLPAICVIFAVEAATLAVGHSLSEPVANAAGEVAERIRAELDGSGKG